MVIAAEVDVCVMVLYNLFHGAYAVVVLATAYWRWISWYDRMNGETGGGGLREEPYSLFKLRQAWLDYKESSLVLIGGCLSITHALYYLPYLTSYKILSRYGGQADCFRSGGCFG